MKKITLKISAMVLAILGLSSCGTCRKAHKAEKAEKEPEQPEAAQPDTLTTRIDRGIMLMYGVPYGDFRPVEVLEPEEAAEQNKKAAENSGK